MEMKLSKISATWIGLFCTLLTIILPPECFALNGFYIGVGAGPEFANFKHNAIVKRDAPFLVGSFNVRDKNHLAGRGVFASIFAGYGKSFAFPYFPYLACERFYLAGEVNAVTASAKHKSSNFESVHESYSQTSTKMGKSLGFAFLPGIFFADSALLYGRLAYDHRKFTLKTTDTSLENKHRHLDGFRYGLGIQHFIMPCVSLRLDGNVGTYKRVKMFVVDGEISKRTFIRPRTLKFELGALYHF